MISVTREELAEYCRIDDEDLLDEAERLAQIQEARLLAKGASSGHPTFTLAIKALTLHELDNPGQKISQGIQDMINELKFSK